MINTLQTGASNLVLADEDQESANLLTLQTQQTAGNFGAVDSPTGQINHAQFFPVTAATSRLIERRRSTGCRRFFCAFPGQTDRKCRRT